MPRARLTGRLIPGYYAKLEQIDDRVQDKLASVETKGKGVVVKKYKGDAALEKGLAVMDRLGYTVQNQSTRKAAFSAAAGVFTQKQIHTVTFVKGGRDAGDEEEGRGAG